MVKNPKKPKPVNFNLEVGTDIIEIVRFKHKPFEQNKKFYESVFSKSEIEYCNKFSDPYPHFAGVFAAKETIIKSFYRPLTMKNIEIFWNKYGKPLVKINKKRINEVKISISHSDLFVIAVSLTFHVKTKK